LSRKNERHIWGDAFPEGFYPFHQKRVTPDFFGINVYCLEGFDPAGIPVREAAGSGMP